MQKLLLSILFILLFGLFSFFSSPGVTYADGTVFGWGGSTMIWVGTGAKDYTHHTQWVSWITVESGASTCPSLYEAWTYGFYASKQMCSPAAITWYIDRWVPSGNYVCGSAHVRLNGIDERQIACIQIKV